jgi:signal transduction histidine kinase
LKPHLSNNSSATINNDCDDSNSLYDDFNYSARFVKRKSDVQSQAVEQYPQVYRSLLDKYSRLAITVEDLVESMDQLKKRNSEQNDFVSMAAHEIKAPLMPILGIAELLQLELEESRSEEINIRKDQIDGIIRNAKKLAKITSEILDVAKIEGLVLVLRKKDFDLDELIRETISDYEKMLIKKNVKLLYQNNDIDDVSLTAAGKEGDGSKTSIFADRGRITQVVSNLLDNAIKYTDYGGSVTVLMTKKKMKNDIRHDGDKEEKPHEKFETTVSIIDSGSGIDEQLLASNKLFSKFGSNDPSGTGLGLYISKKTIEAHGGKIMAENNSDNKGATFTFTLPLRLSR